MSRVFENALAELAEFEELNTDLNRGRGPVQVSGCIDSQKVHLMQEAGESLAWKLVVTYDEARAKEIYDDFQCFGDRVCKHWRGVHSNLSSIQELHQRDGDPQGRQISR